MTLLYLYYNQPVAIPFFEQLGYPNLPFNILFVDDASAEPLVLNWPNATVLRIDEDIPWNMPAANNLALRFLYNKDPKARVLRTDIDHYFTATDLLEISKIELEHNNIVKFCRKTLKPHPNTYLANVSDILEAGGYNEAFCGNYGYDDKELMYRLTKKGFVMRLSSIKAIVNPKMGTKNLNKDTSVNKQKFENIVNHDPQILK